MHTSIKPDLSLFSGKRDERSVAPTVQNGTLRIFLFLFSPFSLSFFLSVYIFSPSSHKSRAAYCILHGIGNDAVPSTFSSDDIRL